MVLLGLAALFPIASGWTSLPILQHQGALQALDDARNVQADHWAPELLQDSENVLRAGMMAERHEEAQLLFFRDFRDAAEQYRLAEERARLTAATAVQRRDDALGAATAALDTTAILMQSVERVAEQMPFPEIERIRLQQARNHAAEAEAFIANGQYEEALEVARLSALEAELACSRAIPLAARFASSDQVSMWQRWVDETIAWSRANSAAAIVVYKEKNLLKLFKDGKLVKTYGADMGRNSLNLKLRAGDAATPEGRYHITSKKGRGNSKYFMALVLDYPNAEDRRRLEAAKRNGEVPRWVRGGNDIEIHGEGGRGADWTLGCVALTNDDIRDLSSRVGVGTPVTIVGGDGRDGTFSNLARAAAAGKFKRQQ